MSEAITNNLDLWSSALLARSTAGRGSNSKLEACGIKKLRALILELAVRGKLLPQDPNDEPASMLLEKIAKEKTRLIEEGKLTKKLSLPDVAEDEKYFSLPKGWVWTRLGEATNYGITDKAEPRDVDEDTWILDLEDVEKETSRLLQKTRFAEKPFQSSKNRFAKGDVIYGKLRPYLDKVIVADEDGVCTTEMIPVRGYADISPFYLRLVMKTPHFIKYADDSTHGMNLPRLGTDKARMALFPLAPYNEQHLIVAKVDELMALCDQLEQQQTHNIKTHQTLVEALLGALTRVVSQQEFSAAWARIASHFNTLFTTEASIDQLKQAILQLAVMGKLIQQDPNDEPARELLKRIQVERARLIAQGQIKQDTRLEIADDEKYFVLPEGWEYARLADITSVLNGRAYAKDELLDAGVPVLRVGNLFTSSHWYYSNLELEEDKYCDSGDLIFAWSASFGPFIWPGPKVIYHYHIWKLKLHSEANLNKLFLYKFLLEKTVEMKASGHGVSMIHMTKQAMEKIVVPVPPLTEQSRIVAKVDELMALCDSLKARIKDAQAIQIHLADAIVEQAVC